MKKKYIAPELEKIEFTLSDVILASKEDPISSEITSGNNSGGGFDDLP